MTAALLVSVPVLRRSPAWPGCETAGRVAIEAGGVKRKVRLSTQRTPLGRFTRFVCPTCSRCCRDLFGVGVTVGCRVCLRVRHEDQTLSRSAWDRHVVLPCRQVARIERRLNGPRLDGDARHRLRLRRQRLLRRMRRELVRRQISLAMMAETALSMAAGNQ